MGINTKEVCQDMRKMKTYKDILEYIRNYKAEYKKFQSSPERIKYRAELVKYNRDKGTYGNGDKKDASHKGGKIVGFEDQSKNRGRAEASRLKKETVKTSPKRPTGMKSPKPAKGPEHKAPGIKGKLMSVAK